MRNIFVSEDDPTMVTGFIDWQSAGVEPAFSYANEIPDFAQLPSEPENNPETAATSSATLCSQAFDAFMKGLVPNLAAAMAVDKALVQPFYHCHRTWIDGAILFRDELIDLATHWQNIGLQGTCPYTLPSQEKIAAHQEDLKVFKQEIEFKRDIAETLKVPHDGWVPSDRWEETKEAHQSLFTTVIEDMDIQDQREIECRWPFDSIDSSCIPKT